MIEPYSKEFHDVQARFEKYLLTTFYFVNLSKPNEEQRKKLLPSIFYNDVFTNALFISYMMGYGVGVSVTIPGAIPSPDVNPHNEKQDQNQSFLVECEKCGNGHKRGWRCPNCCP